MCCMTQIQDEKRFQACTHWIPVLIVVALRLYGTSPTVPLGDKITSIGRQRSILSDAPEVVDL